MHFSLARALARAHTHLLEGLVFFCHYNFALCTELSMPLTLFKYINNKVRTGRLSSPSTTQIWKINSIRFNSQLSIYQFTVTQNSIRRRMVPLLFIHSHRLEMGDCCAPSVSVDTARERARRCHSRDHSMKLKSNAINVECLFLNNFSRFIFQDAWSAPSLALGCYCCWLSLLWHTNHFISNDSFHT